MYIRIIRPLLFLFYPEIVHSFAVTVIKAINQVPGMYHLVSWITGAKQVSSPVEFCGLHFRNRVGLAAGFDKNGSFYNEFTSLGFSFIEIGTITPLPQPGNPKPRSFRLPADKALVNRMGINSIGVEEVIRNLSGRKTSVILGGNIGKNSSTPNVSAADDFEICFRQLYNHVDYFAINVSCPNVTAMSELQDAEVLEDILMRLADIRRNCSIYKPILLKISPDLNFDQIDGVINIYRKSGIDGIIATNTTVQREGLRSAKEKVKQIGHGGLSGRPLADRSTEIIRYITSKTGGTIPIIGVGGIMSPADAIEKLKAGASLVQVYTGFIYNGPIFVKKVNRAVSAYFNQ